MQTYLWLIVTLTKNAKIFLVIVVSRINNMDALSISDYRVIKISVHLIIHIHWWLNLFKSRTTYTSCFLLNNQDLF